MITDIIHLLNCLFFQNIIRSLSVLKTRLAMQVSSIEHNSAIVNYKINYGTDPDLAPANATVNIAKSLHNAYQSMLGNGMSIKPKLYI